MDKMDNNTLTVVYNDLTASLERHKEALPDNFNKKRFVQNCMTVLQDGKQDYSNCDPRSIVRTLLKASFLGLDFFNGECYAIPYKDQCNFQTDYKGELKLCKRYSSNPIKDIYAKLVREGDFFEEEISNGKQTINFKPIPFNNGRIIGAFAVVYYKDGSMIYDTMSTDEIEKTRVAFSKAVNSKAWKETPGEMYKKTVLRRLCKLIDLNFDNSEQMQAFEDGSDFDADKNVESEQVEAKDPFENAIEAEYTEETIPEE